ncbi:LOW QUALITY PROTEIN: synaptonemal complex central element protein 2 [Manacus candei]|uniref:LOW QUALITY PROTEIN: synaptonemal complex central element protein 2 n=1 Tax=Manacus candei TaxID=415023 RepID=UPI0022278D76|nr:LOW QUALITY PROTEIN: synaptonemal complex central element protein 2 [Manacus candei]
MSRKEPEGPEQDGGPGRDPREPLGEDPDRPEPPPCSSRYLSRVSGRVEGLRQRVQGLISRINDGRESDHSALSSFRSSLLLQVSVLAEQLEERLFRLYGLHNERIQRRLRDLAEVMESLDRAQDELRRVCCSMEEAYRDLCLQNEA